MFVVFRNVSDYMTMIFEKTKDDNVMIDRKFKGFIHIINAFHNSIFINSKISIPLKKIWYSFYLDYKKLDEKYIAGEQIYFIFFEGNRLAYQESYIEYLKSRYANAKFIFRYINMISCYNSPYLELVRKEYDLICSMDSGDCEKYGWFYFPNTYWIDKLSLTQLGSTDVLFIGGNKNRHIMLISLYIKLSELGIKCDFYISGVDKSDRRYDLNGIHYIEKNVKYKYYLDRLIGAKAIVEIVSGSQKGSTLRAMEAIFFDKILLTNNINIKQEKYYDSRYMYILQDIKDFSVIKNIIKKPVNYNNKDYISHQAFFNAIENKLKEGN